jgi:hypothetical protein
MFHFLIMSRSGFYGSINPDSEEEPNQVYFVSSSCLLAFDGMALIWYFELTEEVIVASECEFVKTIGNPD